MQVALGVDDTADADAAVDRWIRPGEPSPTGSIRAIRLELEAQSDVPEPAQPGMHRTQARHARDRAAQPRCAAVNLRNQGSALVIALVLLTGLGALALAAAATAMTALALAGHQQMSQNAFEGAETGIVHALMQAAAIRRAGTHAGSIRPDDPTAAADFRTDTREAEGPGALPVGFSIGENAGTFTARNYFITANAELRARRSRQARAGFLSRGPGVMNPSWMTTLGRAAAALAGALASFSGCADTDEAWLTRATLPEGIRPLLAVIVDTSAATARPITVDTPYDPTLEYGAGLPGSARCDPVRVYWRRGAGPAPDCTTQAGLEFAPSRATSGLQCEAARGALGLHGFFVASRAAQWRADGSYWSAPRADSTEAVECRADRGLHGASAGNSYASDSPAGPWRTDDTAEIAWDKPPLADPYIFYGGNYLNYLQSHQAPVERPVADVMLRSLSAALSATAELEVALIRVDPDGPEGGFVMRAPVANALAAAEMQAIAGEPPSGSAPLAETLAEAANWLAGGAIRFGSDARRDPAAFDPSAPSRYRSPFNHACRPVSLAYLTAAVPSDDDLSASAAGGLPEFDELTGGCGATCLSAIARWIAAADLSDALPGKQQAPTTWIAPEPAPALTPEPSDSILDPLAFVNLVTRSFQHDATIPAGPQLSAAGLTPFEGGDHGPGVILGVTAPLRSQRWLGNLLRYGLRAPSSPFAPPDLVDRDGRLAIDPETGLPTASSRSLWSESPDANLLTGGAAGRLPSPDARRIQVNVAGPRLLDPANRLTPANPRLDRAAVGLDATDPASVEDVLSWPAAQRVLGDPGLHSPLVVDYPEASRQLVFATTHDGFLHAFDADSGIELWAWMPNELLSRLPELMRERTD